MKVLQYLNELCWQGMSSQTALEILEENYGIKHSINAKYPNLVVLNYNQISSPKFEQITRECRSLVLRIYEEIDDDCTDIEQFEVVSRSFDRFFNLGEEQDAEYDVSQMVAYEKVDGSLIGLFHTEEYGWLYRTRSMIMPETNVNGWELTWKELIENAINLQGLNEFDTPEWNTYILEVVSPENRVVTRYEEVGAYLLAVRGNKLGSYQTRFEGHYADKLGVKLPKTFTFSTFKECAEAAKELRNLEEGFVCYNSDGIPQVKVKNPAYVSAHSLRGEGLNPKRMMELILMNEQDEYLTIFPEDKGKFEPYLKAHKELLNKIGFAYSCVKDITDQKEFALQVKDLCYSAILFQARAKKKNPIEVWNDQKDSYKMKVLQTFKESLDV